MVIRDWKSFGLTGLFWLAFTAITSIGGWLYYKHQMKFIMSE